MAIVKGPLLSMDARGQINKALVFMGWKGIKTARGYVVPSNPQTAGQTTQRGFMTAVVALWHSLTLTALDVAAFNILASISAGILSGFNVFCRLGIDILKAGNTINAVSKMVRTGTGGGAIHLTFKAAASPTPVVKYGSSPSLLLGSFTPVWDAGPALWKVDEVGLVDDVAIYLQPQHAAGASEMVSGIYKIIV